MVYLSRIYTKSGDRGDTGLGDDQRVTKDHPRVEAYGQVDELNAVLGLVAAYCPDAPEAALLRSVQNDLFDVGADLCVPQPEGEQPGPGLRVTAAQAERLERAIDRLNEGLDPLRSFVLPGGTPAAAWLHLARTVCRRAERAVVVLMRAEASRSGSRSLVQTRRTPVSRRRTTAAEAVCSVPAAAAAATGSSAEVGPLVGTVSLATPAAAAAAAAADYSPAPVAAPA